MTLYRNETGRHGFANATINKPKSNNNTRLIRCIHIASEIASLIVQIRGRPRLLDLFALSTKALDIGLRIHEEITTARSDAPWEFFGMYSNNSHWFVVPTVMANLLMPLAENRKQMTKGTTDTAPCAWIAYVRGIKIGWISSGEGQYDRVFVSKENEEKMMDVLHEALWLSVKSGRAVLTKEGLLDDDTISKMGNVMPTNLVENLSKRVNQFLSADLMRSYLVIGEPGCGKTTAIQYVVHAFGKKSLRIPFKEFMEHGMPKNERDKVPIMILLMIAKPDVLVVDDIDWADKDTQGELLDVTEKLRSSVKIFIASANNAKKIIPALRRPERFDDLIEVGPLDLSTVEDILGVERELSTQLRNWPIVYILEYMRRVRVLGREQARREISELENRLMETRRTEDEMVVDLSRLRVS